MDFFKSVFSEDPNSSDLQKPLKSPSESPKKENPNQEPTFQETNSNSSPNPNSSPKSSDDIGTWSFGGLIKTITSKSETVIQTYKRDLEEFGSELKKETTAIREAANRVVKELPVSIEVGASVAQESIESVWRGTSEIISQSKEAILSIDLDDDSIDNQFIRRYSRFESQVNAIQSDLNTYVEEPDDLDDYSKWKLGFLLEEKGEEIMNLVGENGVMEEVYTKLVPSVVDHETFWYRYFYRVYKLKQVEDARANFVKRAISGEEEDLSWDVDDDENNVYEPRSNSLDIKEEEEEKKESAEPVMENKDIEESQVESSEVVDREIDEKILVVESISDNASNEKVPLEENADISEQNREESITKSDEKILMEEKSDPGESSKSSDVPVVSGQPSVHEEEDLGWDEIEDLGSNDEKKVSVSGSPNVSDLRKPLSAPDEEEDLSWDIEEDDEPVKP